MLKSRLLLMVAGAVLCLFSCKPTIPGKYIQPDQMEDILYDYHIAQGLLENDGTERSDYNRRLYKMAVLEKHGVSEADFDSSMVYYTRHIDNLHTIYEHISARMEQEAENLGADVSDLDRYGSVASAGDTTNVWSREHNLLLIPHAPYNIASYYMNADTAYHAGDRLILSFDTQYIFKEGILSAVAVMSVRLKNDSTITKHIFANMPSHFSLDISDAKKVGIKEVRGFFYTDTQELTDVQNHPMQLTFIRNIKLVRLHQKEENAQ